MKEILLNVAVVVLFVSGSLPIKATAMQIC